VTGAEDGDEQSTGGRSSHVGEVVEFERSHLAEQHIGHCEVEAAPQHVHPRRGQAFAGWFGEGALERTRVPVRGRVVSNDGLLRTALAEQGVGLAYVFEPSVQEQLRDGRLRLVLGSYAATVPGFFLYYPSQAQRPHGCEGDGACPGNGDRGRDGARYPIARGGGSGPMNGGIGQQRDARLRQEGGVKVDAPLRGGAGSRSGPADRPPRRPRGGRRARSRRRRSLASRSRGPPGRRG
jgi:hypothetical protein